MPSFRSDLFMRCREAVTAEQAARFYGLDIKPNHTACCPFHADDKPSLSFKNGFFRCFGCGAHGDAIDYVVMYLGLKPLDAVKKLDSDLGLHLPIDTEQTREDREAMRARARELKEERAFREWKEEQQTRMAIVFRIGREALLNWPDLTELEAWAIQEMPLIEYALDNFNDAAWRRWWEHDKRREAIS